MTDMASVKICKIYIPMKINEIPYSLALFLEITFMIAIIGVCICFFKLWSVWKSKNWSNIGTLLLFSTLSVSVAVLTWILIQSKNRPTTRVPKEIDDPKHIPT